MRTFLEIKKLQAGRFLRQKFEQLMSEEGDTNFVSIMIIIVIILAIAAIFRDQLKAIVEQTMQALLDFLNETK